MHWGNVDKTLSWKFQWGLFSRKGDHQPKWIGYGYQTSWLKLYSQNNFIIISISISISNANANANANANTIILLCVEQHLKLSKWSAVTFS